MELDSQRGKSGLKIVLSRGDSSVVLNSPQLAIPYVVVELPPRSCTWYHVSWC